MKNITTILLFMCLVIVSVKCQDADTLIVFYQEDIDHKDSIIFERDSQIIGLQELLNTDSFSMIADTFQFQLVGKTDNTKTIVTKTGANIFLSIKDDNKRLVSSYGDGKRRSDFMNDFDSTYTVGSLFINSESTKGFGNVELDLNTITD